jgi:hypothetical protein
MFVLVGVNETKAILFVQQYVCYVYVEHVIVIPHLAQLMEFAFLVKKREKQQQKP